MAALGNGILFGLMLTLFIGPVFFALIQTSIEKGFIAGASMAVGVSVSDMIFIFLSYFGISGFAQNVAFKLYFSIIGGVILLCFGVFSIIKPMLNRNKDRTIQNNQNNNQGFLKQVFKGFMLNGVNPSVFLFWIGVMSLATIDYHYSGNDIVLFCSAIIATVLSTDILKSYIANRLGFMVNSHFIVMMNRVVGIVLIAFAIKLFYTAFVMQVMPS